MTTTVAFYAYKGGTGRTMALVHSAWALAREGRRIILVDLDLGAPSLWPLLGDGPPLAGFIELIADWLEGRTPSVEQYLYQVPLDARAAGALYILPAGRMDARYLEVLQGLDWQQLRDVQHRPQDARQQELFAPGKSFFDFFREELVACADPDAIFIDAPTGLSDTANVCLRVLADAVVVLFQPTRVQLEGVGRVVSLLAAEQEALRSVDAPTRPDVFCIASTIMSRRLGGPQMARVQRAFKFLDLVRFEALGRPTLTEEVAELVEQPPAVITHDPTVADLEVVETGVEPDDSQLAAYEDVLRYLRQCIPPRPRPHQRRPSLSRQEKRAKLEDLAPRFQQFAERETGMLGTHFLRSVHVDRLAEPIVAVVLGGKGSGKTALFVYATRQGTAGSVAHRAVHGTGSQGLGSDLLVTLAQRLLARDASIDAFWRIYCLQQSGYSVPEGLAAVHAAMAAMAGVMTGVTALDDVVQVLATPSLPVEVDRAWQIVDETLASRNQGLVLYLDGLDTAFKDDLALRRRGLTALFVAWQATFARLQRVGFKLFLRGDLWEELSFPEKSHLRTRTMHLNWTQEDLWRLVLKRALHSAEFAALCKTWDITPQLDVTSVEASSDHAVNSYLDALFESRIWAGKNSLSRNWIMRRLSDAKGTLFPRDVLCLLQLAMGQEQRRMDEDRLRVAEDAVLSRESLAKALPPTSSQRVDALREEYPELVDVLQLLKGLPAQGKLHELRDHLAQHPLPGGRDPIHLLEKAGVLAIDAGALGRTQRLEQDVPAEKKDTPPMDEGVYRVPALYLHGLNMIRPGPT